MRIMDQDDIETARIVSALTDVEVIGRVHPDAIWSAIATINSMGLAEAIEESMNLGTGTREAPGTPEQNLAEATVDFLNAAVVMLMAQREESRARREKAALAGKEAS